jgi:hypothetical protein
VQHMLVLNVTFYGYEGHGVAQRLRHNSTSRKVVGLRPDEVNEFI